MKTASTEFKNLEGIVFEINLVADKFVDEQMQLSKVKSYFYSSVDGKVHNAGVFVEGKYYDEIHKEHPYDKVYKVLATSNKKKFPELPRLTVLDLAR